VFGLVTAVAACAVLSGCRTAHEPCGPRYLADKHLVFYPDSSGLPPMDFPREPWPVAISGDQPGELIEYQETIYDIQGRPGRESNSYYRRFDAVRSGRAWR